MNNEQFGNQDSQSNLSSSNNVAIEQNDDNKQLGFIDEENSINSGIDPMIKYTQ